MRRQLLVALVALVACRDGGSRVEIAFDPPRRAIAVTYVDPSAP